MSTPDNQPSGGGSNLLWSIISIVATLAVSYFLSGYLQTHFDLPMIVRWIIIIVAVLIVGGLVGRLRR
ncbi:hypothetical protein [Corynebacterium massiliense]|uniref:Uncharacterized protein n=1 Tax=Corynebacterium massiliense DSM 45435 TaxID=1121364 RepID=A0ABY7UAK3_9CORY|nr:hypothetical protein [Corynebacterium massiliense]WCZ33416.1 hypothetical protein CMASS_10040 [Corynebacterium massiliense DSM 45435]